MSRGVKGSGTAKRQYSRKPRDTDSVGVSNVSKSDSNIFGAHSIIIDRMVLGAKLADIIQKDLNMLASDLKSFDDATGYDFGKKILDKVVQAGLSALTSLNINGIVQPSTGANKEVNNA